MKKKIFFIITVAVFFSGLTFAQNKGTGLGIILGEPTGISFKQWTTTTTAFDAAVAWSFTNKGALLLHADHLWHNFALIQSNVPVYYGIGARVKFRKDNTRLGVRIPLGIAYHLQEAPIEFFLEVVPIMDLVPATEFKFAAAIGGRYYFK